jgi:hypothetical protein
MPAETRASWRSCVLSKRHCTSSATPCLPWGKSGRRLTRSRVKQCGVLPAKPQVLRRPRRSGAARARLRRLTGLAESRGSPGLTSRRRGGEALAGLLSMGHRQAQNRAVARKVGRQARQAAAQGAVPKVRAQGWRRARVSGCHYRERRGRARWMAERGENRWGRSDAPRLTKDLPTGVVECEPRGGITLENSEHHNVMAL